MLETQNEAWGFWGTMGDLAVTAWGYAFDRVLDATAMDDEEVRAFLDSRHGRWFADEVQNNLFAGATLDAAIDTAIRRWMSRPMRRAEAHYHDVPQGTPYLVAVVALCGMAE